MRSRAVNTGSALLVVLVWLYTYQKIETLGRQNEMLKAIDDTSVQSQVTNLNEETSSALPKLSRETRKRAQRIQNRILYNVPQPVIVPDRLPPLNESWEFDDILGLPSEVRDRTVRWEPSVNRLWLRKRNKEGNQPPAMLLLTKYGWNQRNQYSGRGWGRSMRQRELLYALINHPWFHPTAWQDIYEGRMEISNSTRYYVFLDLETCGDKNYPVYGDRVRNMDQIGKRGRRGGDSHEEEIKDALESAVMKNPGSKIVIFDCNGYVRTKQIENQFWRRDWNKDERLVLVSLSANHSQHLPGDLGLSPPPCQKCELSTEQIHRILECTDEDSRPFVITFSGNFRSTTRQHLKTLHNGRDVLITGPEEMAMAMNETQFPASFKKMASKSKFAATPRGDNLFSYRFSEVMGCGAIPVVYADGYIFPLSKQLLDPREYAVVIPESDVNRTLDILADISPDTRCRLRRRAFEIYERYFKDAHGTLRGILEALEQPYYAH